MEKELTRRWTIGVGTIWKAVVYAREKQKGPGLPVRDRQIPYDPTRMWNLMNEVN